MARKDYTGTRKKGTVPVKKGDCPVISAVLELRREVGHATVQAGQLPVVGFRHFDAVPLAQLHHDVQEVHRVQFELVSERHVALHVGEVLIGCDHADDLKDGLPDLVVRHIETAPRWAGHSWREKIHDLDSFYNNYRVDAQHAGRLVQDIVNPGQCFRGIQHQIRDFALGVQVVHVDGWVDDAVVESRQISC